MTTDHRQASIAEIRKTLAFFGMPINDLSAEEIEQGCVRLTEAVRASGFSMEQAYRGLQQWAAMSAWPEQHEQIAGAPDQVSQS